MHSNQPDFAAMLISDCIHHGITDPEQIVESIAGQYIVDDCKNDIFSLMDVTTVSEQE